MGTIQVHKNGTQPASPAVATGTVLDPARWLSRMMGWDPFREMAPLFPDTRLTFEPAFEIKETKDGYLFKADVPGIKEPDLDVSVTGNRLTIRGKREEEKEDKSETYYAYERSYGSFTRSFTLPESVDTSAVRAELKDGVLAISIPKTAEAQPKKIPVATKKP